MLKKSILIEGPDGAGKSALYKRMTEEWGFHPGGHDGGPPESAEDVWSRLAMFAARAPCVRDRSPAISDIVYSRALNRDTKLSVDMYLYWLKEFKPFVVYCRPPDGEILKVDVIARPHKSQEHVDQIKDKRLLIAILYDGVIPYIAGMARLPWLKYDWTKDPDGTILYEGLMTEDVCAD